MPKKKVAPEIHINLIPEEAFFTSPLGRFVRWSLSVGRYLVIITELVVIISFASRFSLDRKITDLNKEIVQKVSVIESYNSFEKEFLAAQAKLKQYNELEKQRNLAIVFEYLSDVTPPEVQVGNLTIRTDGISVTGTTTSQSAFNTLINNLSLSPHFSEVNIGRVSTVADQAGYSFQFTASTVNPGDSKKPVPEKSKPKKAESL